MHTVQMEKGLWKIYLKLKSQNFINSIHLNVIIKQQAKMSFLEIWLLVELSVLYVHYLFKIFIKI